MNIKQKLLGHKRIKIDGMKFTIKKLNPFIDFPAEKMPQIFTATLAQKKAEENKQAQNTDFNKFKDDLYMIVNAGVVEPKILPVGKGEEHGKEDGITVEDLFRDMEFGFKLYTEIMIHSMNRFKGLRGIFFSMKTRHLLYTTWRNNMAKVQQKLSLNTEN